MVGGRRCIDVVYKVLSTLKGLRGHDGNANDFAAVILTLSYSYGSGAAPRVICRLDIVAFTKQSSVIKAASFQSNSSNQCMLALNAIIDVI